MDDLCNDEVTTNEKHEERTSTVVVVEEGQALIVKGDGLPISQLSIQSGVYSQKYIGFIAEPRLTLGTTHLLIRSSSTPNSVLPSSQHVFLNISVPTSLGHLSQLSRPSPSCSCALRELGRTEHCPKPPTRPASLSVPPRVCAGSHS